MKYRFSGHETFACRYSWLPKAVSAVLEKPKVFFDEDNAMVVLGVGKNMVRAIRFWAEAAGVIQSNQKNYNLTEFGKLIFLPQSGYDPFLEDTKTLWLIHWNIATQFNSPLFTWEFLLNKWQEPEFTRSAFMAVVSKNPSVLAEVRSEATLESQFDVFIHSYLQSQIRKGTLLEDSLDCPLTELQLVQIAGEKLISGHRETVYTFNREDKQEVSAELFAYCIYDYFMRKHPEEATLSFREISIGLGSPGQVFKLSEADIRERIVDLRRITDGVLEFKESASLQQVCRLKHIRLKSLLKSIYTRETISA